MADKKEKQSSAIGCPHCGAASMGGFSTVVKADDAGPIEILYKCDVCGRFYTVERVISFRIKKG